MDYLHEIGASEVIADELEASLQLSSFLLHRFEVPGDMVQQLQAALREEQAHRRDRGEEIEPDKIPGYFSVLREGNIELQAIPEDSPCIGRSLAELNFRSQTGAMVVGAIRRDRTIPNPEPDFRIDRGDTLMLLGAADEILKAREFIHGHPV